MLKTCGDMSLDEVEGDFLRHLADGSLHAALDAVRDAVDVVINNPRSVARVYASHRLDQLCERVAAEIAGPAPDIGATPTQGGGTIIMATELAAAGGHVEVIKDLIRLGEIPQPVVLWLTDNFQRIDPVVQQGYAEAIGVPLNIARGVDSGERLHSTMAFMAAQHPHTVVMLVHNQDSVGIVAGLACDAQKIVFVHHGDHHLSLGVTCSRFTHVDLSNFAFFNCRNAIGVQHNTYWPLTLCSHKEHRHDGNFMRDGHLVTSCAGRPEKFDDPSYQYQYLDLVGFILHVTGGHHLHVGQLRDDQIARIRVGLDRHGISHDRFEHLPWVSSVSEALAKRGVDLYLTSFPYGGGKSQVEVMASAIPTLIHSNYRSRVLCGIDLGYPGVFTWRDVSGLERVLRAVTPEVLRTHAAQARAHFESHHSEPALRRAMRASSIHGQHVPSLAEVHEDGLQLFLEDERPLHTAMIRARDNNDVIARLSQNAVRQEAEMGVLRKKARFLGSFRYRLTALLKSARQTR